MVVLYCNASKNPAKCTIDERTVEEYKIRTVGHLLVFHIFSHMVDIFQGSTIHLVLPIRGGGRSLPKMSIAAGGRIKQVVKKDKSPNRWIGTHTTVFNVQILNSAVYQSVTGIPAPSCPISMDTYKQHGFPFFNIPEESTGISGGFGTLKSISEIDGVKEDEVEPAVVQILEKRDYTGKQYPRIVLLKAYTNSTGDFISSNIEITNSDGPLREFRTVADLETELEGYHIAKF
jgi:hypothetical protein